MTSPIMKRRKQRNESNSEENEDRLSELPDSVLLHILSLLNAKEAVRSCILSTRWNHLWKRLPSLTLSSLDFWTVKGFAKFVSRILSLRDGSTALQGLDFHRGGRVEPHLLKRIVKYAISHNVQRLRLSVSCCRIEPILPCIFSSQTLTSLSLSLEPDRFYTGTTLFPNSLNLPALTTLYLWRFGFCGGDDGRAEPFSALKRLNSLTIEYCQFVDAKILCISSLTLVNLTIHGYLGDYSTIELHAPSLCLFAFVGTPFQKLRSHLSSIPQVIIDADMVSRIMPPLVPLSLSWLIQFPNIKSLTFFATDLKVLSLVPDLLKAKLPSLCNLKSLKVKLNPPSSQLDAIVSKRWKDAFKRGLKRSSSIPDGIVDSLLQNSPLAEVDIIELIRL